MEGQAKGLLLAKNSRLQHIVSASAYGAIAVIDARIARNVRFALNTGRLRARSQTTVPDPKRNWEPARPPDTIDQDQCASSMPKVHSFPIRWQLSAKGYPWIDTVCALGVAALVMYLAYGLFKRALPAMVDQFAVEPERLLGVVKGVAGVREVGRIRSRWVGTNPRIDMVISVDPDLSTTEAHEIADAIEKLLEERFQTRDISIHIEPYG